MNNLTKQQANKEILEMFIYNFKEFENKYKSLTRYVQRMQDKNEKLEKENQEIKGKIALQQSSYEKEFRELNDKLLKVVESVLNNHIHMNDKCSCFWESETDTFGEHLLQEIRKAMEKMKGKYANK